MVTTKEFLEQFRCCNGEKLTIREDAQTLMSDEECSYAFCEKCGYVVLVKEYQVDEEEISSL
jgi:DNA-directed RNA polymerase subunit RPC12/RpoP